MTMQTQTYDFVIIGAGIIGLTIANELLKKYPECKIAIIEKESAVAMHASGRNSGVLHAGFYYTADSLKAKFTVRGNQLMQQFCESNQLPINRCQKLVVAQNESELATLDELYNRGIKNGVEISMISATEAQQIDPNVKTTKRALLSPNTASVDPKQVCERLQKLLDGNKVEFVFNCKVLNIDSDKQIINCKHQQFKAIAYKHLINAAGLYADKLAQQMGIGEQYTMLPFKGRYLKFNNYVAGKKASNLVNPVNMHIYPVPNLGNPFLGVHFTQTVDNHTKIGPTAIPAFWREHYQGFNNFNLAECLEILRWYGILMAGNHFDFRSLAWQEIQKYRKNKLINDAKNLVQQLSPEQSSQFINGPCGIRAQLFDKVNKKLVMDFVVEQQTNATHVLNAVSPAFTCSFAFAEHVVQGMKTSP